MEVNGNSNRQQKNKVRVALAASATVATLIGTQIMAFADRRDTVTTSSAEAAQVIEADGAANSEPSTTPTTTRITTSRSGAVQVAPSQPRPRTRASR